MFIVAKEMFCGLGGKRNMTDGHCYQTVGQRDTGKQCYGLALIAMSSSSFRDVIVGQIQYVPLIADLVTCTFCTFYQI